MPYSSNSGGPWGGGGNNGNNGGGGPWGGGGDDNGGGGDDRNRRPGGNRRPGQGGVPDIDDVIRKGQEQLKVLIGGRSGGGGSGGGGGGPAFNRNSISLILLAALGVWLFNSFYRVDTSEQSVEFLFGKYAETGQEGLNFAPWPIYTYEILPVTQERTEPIGVSSVGSTRRSEEGLMLTGDENIVDIDFDVVWNISDPALYLFNLEDPPGTIRAVAESAMREVIGRSQLAPILNRDREVVAEEVRAVVQDTLDSYESGVNIVRLNFDRADPPQDVIEAFRDVQAAEQERDTKEKQADAYANQALAAARGEAERVLQEAEGYRAQTVNEATGEASRFVAVFNEYSKAEEVTRKRLYLETMERVLGSVDKIIIDGGIGGGDGGNGVVPYLPLNELRRQGTN